MNGHCGPSMVITDLDGTLLGPDGKMTARDEAVLTDLGRQGIVRVIATGRNLYSFGTVSGHRLPADYVIFSTGAGVIMLPDSRLIRNIRLDAADAAAAARILMQFDLDFMVHEPIPENHRFCYHWTGRDNPDFHRRLARYKPFSRPVELPLKDIGPASQLLAVVHPDTGADLLAALASSLKEYSVIRSTSPLDGESVWIEIFAPSVSKSRCAAWLARRLNIDKDLVLAVGNDYNDQDMLEWAGTAFLVDNAPEILKERFPSVASQKHAGVAEAVERWLAIRSLQPV